MTTEIFSACIIIKLYRLNKSPLIIKFIKFKFKKKGIMRYLNIKIIFHSVKSRDKKAKIVDFYY